MATCVARRSAGCRGMARGRDPQTHVAATLMIASVDFVIVGGVVVGGVKFRFRCYPTLFQIRRQHIFDPFHECADSARQIAPMCYDEGHGERPRMDGRNSMKQRGSGLFIARPALFKTGVIDLKRFGRHAADAAHGKKQRVWRVRCPGLSDIVVQQELVRVRPQAYLVDFARPLVADVRFHDVLCEYVA